MPGNKVKKIIVKKSLKNSSDSIDISYVNLQIAGGDFDPLFNFSKLTFLESG